MMKKILRRNLIPLLSVESPLLPVIWCFAGFAVCGREFIPDSQNRSFRSMAEIGIPIASTIIAGSRRAVEMTVGSSRVEPRFLAPRPQTPRPPASGMNPAPSTGKSLS